MKHTPGPWKWAGEMLCTEKTVCGVTSPKEIILWPSNALSGDDCTPAELMGSCGKHTETHAEANQSIIEASPQLYEVLKAIHDAYYVGHKTDAGFVKAMSYFADDMKAALAKAEAHK